MIDLTPLEVRKKKGDFKRQMRGYDPELVDDFLDLVADRLEQLVRENIGLNERTTMLEGQVADFRDREKALTEALVTAQEMREEIRRQVAKEAELARREAEAASESILSAAAAQREREEEAIRRLRARQTQLLNTYRSYLERELAELAVMSETLEVHRTRPVFSDDGDIMDAEERPRLRKPEAAAPPAPAAPTGPTLVDAAHERHLPAQQIDLTDEVDEDVEETGWVSTLIERKS